MNRGDWLFAATVFVIILLEVLVALAWLPLQVLPGSVLYRFPFAELLGLAISAGCASYVARAAIRQRMAARVIESLPTQRERLGVEPKPPHMSALDYCLLLPVFLIAFGVFQAVLTLLVTALAFGIPAERIPRAASTGIPAVLAAWLTFSHTRYTIRRRYKRKLDRRARQLARRAAAVGRGHCPVCGYDLTGLPERRCPECGETWTADEGKDAGGKR